MHCVGAQPLVSVLFAAVLIALFFVKNFFITCLNNNIERLLKLEIKLLGKPIQVVSSSNTFENIFYIIFVKRDLGKSC